MFGLPSLALVKGSSPPPKKAKSERGTCKTIDDCQDIGDKREEELFANSDDEAAVKKTAQGDRFKDITIGEGAEVAFGSIVTLKYRVLRLGKRSRDGVSGGTD
jgi:FKBP-type peptidyl-prolyl cis-trans isomerase